MSTRRRTRFAVAFGLGSRARQVGRRWVSVAGSAVVVLVGVAVLARAVRHHPGWTAVHLWVHEPGPRTVPQADDEPACRRRRWTHEPRTPPVRPRTGQDLRQHDRPRRRRRGPRERRVARRHGPVRLGQVDAPALPRGHPRGGPRIRVAQRPRRRCSGRPRALAAAPEALRVRVPVRSAAVRAARRGERRAAGHAARRLPQGRHGPRGAVARLARARRDGGPAPGRAVRRARRSGSRSRGR